jgi:glutathione synthase
MIMKQKVIGMAKRLKIGFVMDPMEKIHWEDDTSCSLMVECQQRGYHIYYLLLQDIAILHNEPKADLRRVELDLKKGFKTLSVKEKQPLEALDALFIRKEPPFDMDYLYLTYLLDRVIRKIFMVNHPGGIRKANEKLYTLNFPEVAPKNCVSKNPKVLKEFFMELGEEMILKPLDNRGGIDIFYLKKGDKNINVILESLTSNGQRFVLAQEYLPEIKNGDKRILLLDGKPIGAFNRVPPRDDHRANMHIGGRCEKTEITKSDEKICSVLSERLVADGLSFVGIDVIGNKVTEINVTSPAGIPEINSFNKSHLEKQTIDFVEERILK